MILQMPMAFEILGPLRVHGESHDVTIGAAKERALLAVLLLEHGRVVPIDRLIDEVWGGSPPSQAVGSLRVLASRLRRALTAAGCPDRVRTVPPGYMIAVEPDELDAGLFAAMAHDGAALLRSGDPEQAAAVLRSALGLWRGDVLADVALGDGSMAALRRLGEDRLVAFEQRVEADLCCGRHEQVIAELEDVVRLHPLRETLWQKLVLALVRSGRQADSLRRVAEFTDIVGDIGLDPSPSFSALATSVGRHDDGLMWTSTVEDEPVRPEAVPQQPLPRQLGQGATTLIGRRTELARLLAVHDAVGRGESATVLISGEPGVGKTSLTTELATLAHERGSTVLYGQCDEDLQIAYQPFREALQEHFSSLGRSGIEAELTRWPRLARLAGPYADLFDISTTPGADAEGERALLFESVEGWLQDLAQRGPVVLVIDDLHWASGPTVQLLRHLSHQKWWPLLCLATFRDTDAAEPSGLRAMLAGVHRQPNIHRISLQGLDRDGITRLVEERTGRVLGEGDLRLAQRIHDETGGNPFFATQLIRHLLESGAALAHDSATLPEQFQLPDGVRDVIRQRVERLSPAANQVLRVAATIGPASPFALLAAVPLSGDVAGLLDALDEATRARLLVETNDADFVFAHALVRKTIYGALSSARRRQLHRAVGEALIALPTPLADQTVSLAHHFCQGAGPGDGPRAATYALMAGREALDQVAQEMAQQQFESGLEVLERYGPGAPDLEADLYLGVAEACNRKNDHHGRSRAAWKAAEAARAAESSDRLAHAAFWMARFGVVGSLDPRAVGLCEEALAWLGGPPSAIKARVLGVLASLRALAGEGVDADPIAVEAVDVARSIDDPQALAEALDARFTTLSGSPEVEQRLRVSEEMVQISRASNDLSALGNGHRFRGAARLVSGDRAGFDEDFSAMTLLGERMRDGFLRAISAQWRATVALLDGRLADVEACAGEAVELSGQDPNFVNAWAAQLLWLRHEQGRLAEFLPLLQATVADNPAIVGFRAALAMACATLGLRDEAQHHLDEILAGRPRPIPRDWIRTATLTLCAETAACLGDAVAARQLETELRPFAGQLVLVATGTHCPGAVDRFRGMLAATRNEFERAEAYFGSALALEERARTAPNTARTRLWYARALARSGDDMAVDLASEAEVTAERLGMHGVATEARALLADPFGSENSPSK